MSTWRGEGRRREERSGKVLAIRHGREFGRRRKVAFDRVRVTDVSEHWAATTDKVASRHSVSRRNDPTTHNKDDEVRRFHGLNAN